MTWSMHVLYKIYDCGSMLFWFAGVRLAMVEARTLQRQGTQVKRGRKQAILLACTQECGILAPP
jgi:hypothetical protein